MHDHMHDHPAAIRSVSPSVFPSVPPSVSPDTSNRVSGTRFDRHAVGLDIVIDGGAGDVTILALHGDLVGRHRGRVVEAVESVLVDPEPTIVIDLGGVTLLDTPTLAAVTRPVAHARRRGARVTILPPGGDRELSARPVASAG